MSSLSLAQHVTKVQSVLNPATLSKLAPAGSFASRYAGMTATPIGKPGAGGDVPMSGGGDVVKASGYYVNVGENPDEGDQTKKILIIGGAAVAAVLAAVVIVKLKKRKK